MRLLQWLFWINLNPQISQWKRFSPLSCLKDTFSENLDPQFIQWELFSILCVSISFFAIAILSILKSTDITQETFLSCVSYHVYSERRFYGNCNSPDFTRNGLSPKSVEWAANPINSVKEFLFV